MSDKFPRFFDVNDTVVKVDFDPESDEVFGMVVLTGAPFSLGKARVEGSEITEEEANRLLDANSASE